MISFAGKSYDQIEALFVVHPLHELIGPVFRLTNLDPHFTVREIATARRCGWRKVRKLMESGVISPAHKIGRTNDWQAPLSAIRRWDAQTAIRLERNG